MTVAPWRGRVSLGDSNRHSVAAFRSSYPDFAGLGRIARGKLITLERPRKTFNFLVNPSDISTSYGISDALDLTNPDMLNGAVTMLTDGLNSVSFNLLLDRTYEVYYGTAQWRGGVLHDVLALEQVLGIPEDAMDDIIESVGFNDPEARAARSSGNARAVEESQKDTLKGLIAKKYLRVLFGEDTESFSFDGFVNSLSVHYTHFSNRMVPTRAGVSMTMVSLGSGGSGPDTGQSYSTAQTQAGPAGGTMAPI